ncbi:MAG TPA: SOS response-associated peptidase family protein, partial [Candidatus Thermoplasmatota archaeon]|nr:SOS response-associated peptidase family protein [Candidatus Thermoplasmatota archaeon]
PGFDVPGHGLAFNVRSEDAPASSFWGPLVGRQHAVVPATGFYEWQQRGPGRVPHFIRRQDGQPMLFAALVATRHAGDGGPRLCASILTAEPSPAMHGLHDRMPVFLEPQDVADWLNGGEAAYARLARTPDAGLAIHEVGSRVNRTGEEGESLIRPVPKQARL